MDKKLFAMALEARIPQEGNVPETRLLRQFFWTAINELLENTRGGIEKQVALDALDPVFDLDLMALDPRVQEFSYECKRQIEEVFQGRDTNAQPLTRHSDAPATITTEEAPYDTASAVIESA